MKEEGASEEKEKKMITKPNKVREKIKKIKKRYKKNYNSEQK